MIHVEIDVTWKKHEVIVGISELQNERKEVISELFVLALGVQCGCDGSNLPRHCQESPPPKRHLDI